MGSRRDTPPVSGVLLAQEQLLPFLLNPQSYPHRPRTVRLIQTHSSFVLVAPPFVYKVKKPVNFGFLDFSTLEKRRQFCEREVELNRRLCPHTYLGVVPIVRNRGGFAFGTDGTVVEYAVRMRRLRDGCFLDQRIHRGEVGAADLNRVVRVLRDFYRAQEPTPEIESWGRVERLRISTDENFRQILPGGIFPQSEQTLTYYNLSAGYNILPGEVFFGSRWAKASALYLMAGVGSTKFLEQRKQTVNFGLGLRVFFKDWGALQVDLRDHVYSLDLLGRRQNTQNIELTAGVTFFF